MSNPMSISTIKLKSLDNKGFSYLLEIDNTKIQINSTDQSEITDCCLITHPAPIFLKSLFSLKSKRIICSIPTHFISKIEILEQNKRKKKFSESQIENFFSKIETVKYLQPIYVNSIKIVGYNSGYSLGGTVWHIKVGIEDIIVMINVNHLKENHIDGISIEIKKPFLTILNPGYVFQKPMSRLKRNTEFLSKIKEINTNQDFEIKEDCKNLIKKNIIENKIVIFISYARFLELAFLLSEFKNKRIVLLGSYSKMYLENIKTLLEWTGTHSMNIFAETKNNPLILDIEPMEYFKNLPDYDIYIIPDPFSIYSKKILVDLNGKCSIINCYDNFNEYLEENENNFEDMKFFNTLINSTAEKLLIPIIDLKEVEISKNDDVSEETDENETQNKSDYWYENGATYFFNSESQKMKIIFPTQKKNRKDDYGEYFELDFNEKIEEKEEMVHIEKYTIETVQYSEILVKFQIPIEIFDLGGISDVFAIKKVVEGINCQNLVILNGAGSNFIANYISGKVLENSIEYFIPKVDFLNEIPECKMYEFKGKFIGCKNVEMLLMYPFNVKKLKERIFEENLKLSMKVKTDGVIELFSKELYAKINKDTIILEGIMDERYFILRDILYENLIFLKD